MDIPEFSPDKSADQAHMALKQSVEIMDRAQHCAVLWFAEILKRRLFRKLGYSSMNQYAAEELGFSVTKAGDFKRLAESLERLPKVAAKVMTGELGYTKAREIVKVADPSTEDDWLAVASKQTRRELEATVKHAKKLAAQKRKADPAQTELVPRNDPVAPPAAAPVRIGFDFTPVQYAHYEALMAKIGPHENKADLLLEMMGAYLAGNESAPRGASVPHYQIHVHECPTCAKTTVQTIQGEKELTKTEAEVVRCDAVIHEPGKRNKSTIAPRVRREVLARDRHRCRRKGCNHTRFLDIHHIIPRAEGGTNDPSNLITLCSGCHHLWHERGGDLMGLLSPPCGRLSTNENGIPKPPQVSTCSKPPANS
jgi:5-methylcytosine-specific restriction endonuclease McrA